MGLNRQLANLPDAITTDTSNNVGIGGAANASFKLQVTGATNLTGALSGTSATFSGAVTLATSSGVLAVNTTGRPAGVGGGDNGKIWSKQATTGNYGIATIASATDSFTYIGHNGTDALLGTSYGTTGAYTDLVLQTADTTRFRLSGSTGAATFSAASGGAITLTTNGSANNWASAITGNSTTSQSYGLLIQAGTNSTDAALRVRNQANSLDWLFVRGDGNVGIGTISPIGKLNVKGGRSIVTATASDSNIFVEHTGSLGVIGVTYDTGGAYYPLAFNTSDTERMRILTGGNTEIYNSLSVGTTIGSNARLTVQGGDSTSSNYAIDVKNSTTTMFFVRNDGYMYFGLSANSPYNIAQSGRTCILASNGSVGYLVSTRESKANIKSIKNVDFINQLNPVQFNYRKKDNKTNEFTDELYDNITYGFIADEVEKVNKELVFYNSDGTTLAGVEYNSMIAILTKAVQELKAEIDELKNK